MKRIILLFVGLLSLPFFSYSGGIVHNTNQSASWVRNFARDASTDIDAVFYNPAGLTKLDDGFYFSINNQYLTQKRLITSDYKYLNDAPASEFEGSVVAPVFPSVYAAYKKGKFALSFGWNPVGGGGSATFENGLPSFETMLADLVPVIGGQLLGVDALVESMTGTNPGFSNVTGYGADIFFEGSSVFWGYQLNGSYEINDVISIAVGARYISAQNTYTGHLKDVTIDAPAVYGGTQAPGDYLRVVSTATGGNPALDGFAALLDGQTADFEVDVAQTGSGITPIIGVNITPNEKMNIAVKYEFATKLELENDTKIDGSGLFPDKEVNRSDIPGFLSLGLDYQMTDKLSIATGIHYYLDESADYGHKDANGDPISNDYIMNNNFWEWALGFEYAVSEKINLSVSYLKAQTGVKESFQSDLNHSLSSNTFGFGGGYAISPKIDLNLGIAFSNYPESEKNYVTPSMTGEMVPTIDTFDRSNFFVGLGLDFKLGGKSE